MRLLLAACALSAVVVPPRTPTVTVLMLYRDQVAPEREAEYRAIEEDAARICVELDCPHPHLALESLTGPKEVWWFNTFASDAERQRIVEAYAGNAPLLAALAGIAKRKEGIAKGVDVDVLATYQPHVSEGGAWSAAGARFVVGAIGERTNRLKGVVFETRDGRWIVLKAARTRPEADAIAARAGAEAIVFAVRPCWGMAAPEWITADPEFWKVNPRASATRHE